MRYANIGLDVWPKRFYRTPEVVTIGTYDCLLHLMITCWSIVL